MSSDYLKVVIDIVSEVIEENGLDPVPLEGKTNILHDTPLDSIGLAMVVGKLEDKSGKDPFSAGFISFNTIEELAALYEH